LRFRDKLKMTQEEILKLQAGKELDSLVAREVLGIKPEETKHYSTEITDVWKVVEKLNDYAWFYLGRGKDNWYATVRDRRIKRGQTTAPPCTTAPEAICKAALLALVETRGRR
jgi:hypothetical protein